MLRSRRFAALTALAVLAALPAALPAAAQLPSPVAEVLPVDGATVHVDEWGVPHVEADDPIVAARAFGYAQARDRLFEMDVIRRMGQGRLGELLGSGQHAADAEMRAHFYDADDIDAQLEELPTETMALLEAYSQGVNRARLEQLLNATQLPVAYAALLDLPGPWTPHDSASVLLLFTMASFAGEGEGGELENAARLAALVERFGEEEGRAAFDDFLPVHDDSAFTVIQDIDAPPAPEGVLAEPGTPHERQLDLDPTSATRAYQVLDGALEAARQALAALPVPRVGSYAYALSGDRTASGGGLLLGAPQAGMMFPSTFHEIGVHDRTRSCRGMTVPGLGPFIAIGECNGHTWSLVAGNAGDQVDVFVLPLDPADPDRYLIDGASEPFRDRTETFLVKSTLDAELERRTETYRYWRHGLVFDVDEDAGVAYGLRRAQTGVFTGTFEGLRRLNTVSGVPAILDEVLPHLLATYNGLFADADGHIGYALTGLQPIRAEGYDRRFPMPADADWRGFIPPEEMPQVMDPTDGILVVAQGVESKSVSWWPASSWLSIGRVNRVEPLHAYFTEGDDWDADAMAQADRDTIETLDAQIRFFAPYLDEALSDLPADDELAPLAALWEGWKAIDFARIDADGDGRFDHPGPAVFSPERYYGIQAAPMWGHLLDLVFDEVPGGGWGQYFSRLSQLKHALDGPDAGRVLSRDYLDVGDRDRAEVRAELVREALRRSLPQLVERYGEDPEGWLLEIPEIRFEPIGLSAPRPMRVVDRGTYNQVVDPAAGVSWSILPPGNGRADRALDEVRHQLTGTMPTHADDQIELYEAWGYKDMHTHDYAAAAVETFVVP
jgi:penicillin G amidase